MKHYSNKKKWSTLFVFMLLLYIGSILLLKYQNQLFILLYPDKIWIHRVNSIEKLIEVNSKFNNVELDIVFNKKTNSFDVNHPPAPSINLTLYDYLSSINTTSRNNFWLDFKNLNKNNKESSLKKLNLICKNLNLNKNQFVIESTSPIHLLSHHLDGFKTSYYLPPQLNKLNKKKQITKLNEIQKNCSISKVDYISTDVSDYNILQKHFSNKKKLLWLFDMNKKPTLINPIYIVKHLLDFYRNTKILSNKQVKIVLFNYTSIKGNR